MTKLKFSYKNSKMNKLAEELGFSKNQVVSFDLPAGFTCPMADMCQTYSNRLTGKITDGKNAKFRCYASNLESAFKNVRLAHWFNFDAIRESSNVGELINSSLPKNVKVVRIHSSGDFFTRDYFMAWVRVAELNPQVSFFGYTKIIAYVDFIKPSNFKLVYSHGGKQDSMITTQPTSYVVNTVEDANRAGLKVSCQENPVDDFYLVMNQESFALVLHGTQKKSARGSL